MRRAWARPGGRALAVAAGLAGVLATALIPGAGAGPFGAAPLAAQAPRPPASGPTGAASGEPILVPEEARSSALADLASLDLCLRSTGTTREGDLQRLRTLYLLAVDDKPGLARAWEVHARLASSAWGRTGGGEALLTGYRGALLALEAKHGFWPHTRIRDLRRALDVLDAQVEATPDHEEVRYLRMLSTAFLPAILGRGEGVDDDLEALVTLLPVAVDAYPMRTWTQMADAVQALVETRDAAAAREARAAFAPARVTARRTGIPLVPGCNVG